MYLASFTVGFRKKWEKGIDSLERKGDRQYNLISCLSHYAALPPNQQSAARCRASAPLPGSNL
jgi:hypothetical protein